MLHDLQVLRTFYRIHQGGVAIDGGAHGESTVGAQVEDGLVPSIQMVAHF